MIHEQIFVSDQNSIRLDTFLTKQLKEFSRTYIQDLIKRSCVFVNEKSITSSGLKLKEKDLVKIIFPKKIKMSSKDKKKIIEKIEVLYEDKNTLVINKPQGLNVHPTKMTDTSPNVVSLLIDGRYDFSIKNSIRPGIVHRLDKWTSGALLVAKNDQALDYYSNLFKERKVEKIYITLLDGLFPHKKGIIEAPIDRSKTDRHRMAISYSGKLAKTEFEVLGKSDKYTLVKIKLLTGRTHQIRVHFESVKFPVVGDQIYNKKENEFEDILKGQFLHAYKLSFNLFKTNKKLEIKAKLPDNFIEILEKLKLSNLINKI